MKHIKLKHIKLLAAFAAISLVGAACTTDSSSDQIEATAQLVEKVSELRVSLDHSSDEFGALQTRADNSASALEGFVDSAATHAIDRTAGIPDPPEGQVAVRVSFAYQPDTLPGAGVEVYQPLAEVSAIWAMESLGPELELPVGDLVPGRTVFIAPGEKVAVTLAYQNPSESEVRFMAVPHQDSPGALNGMIWPQCLCFSFPYSAPAEGSWYRVIELTASPDIPVGSKVDILWTLLTDSSVFPEA